ncbi:uncharacterized protein [Chelonus insularis]|uniref:uncharacterized protein n=1 Tax=Chelonus insularis TaxID=460826 RepID=UPI0015890ECE|nr:uncharacterized protein LOC118064846 [Chelonus insularis]
MRCLIAFTALLLVARFGQGVPVKFEENVGKSVTLESGQAPTEKFECFLTHNDKIYQIHPIKNLTFGHKNFHSDKCSLWLTDLNLKHAGQWNMTISWTVDGETFKNTREYEIHLIKDISTAYQTSSGDSSNEFFTYFSTEEGTYVTVFPQKQFHDIKKCLLIHDRGYAGEDIYDLLNSTQTSPNMELHRECGVRMLVDSSKAGHWYIKQQSAPFLYEKFQFWIDISIQPSYKSQENLLWLLGSTEEIKVEGLSQPTYCNLTRPDKKTILIEDNSCTYHIPKVSRDHEGLWIIQYLIPEKINLMEKKFMVEIRDPDYVNVSISYDTGINLMCKMIRTNSDFCVFTRPDGVAINLPQGIGNDRYEYYGNGYKQYLPNEETDTECGLTIRQPINEDFGVWKCSFGHRGKIMSAYVSLDDEFNPNYILPSENIYAKRGDDFKIKCQTFTQLDYCWLLSPNGTIYSVSKNKNSDNTLTYEGEGLNVGVCGAKVENASDAHVGNWSCRMGTIDGIEKEVPVLVTVTESYMYPNQSIINITSSDAKIKLGCNVLPQKEATIRYCRWVRPDGYGIHKEESAQYSTSQGVRACSLEIREYNELNIGKWSCYARLSDDLGIEVFATMEINQKDKYRSFLESVSTATLSIVIICLVTIIPVMFFIAGFILYRKKTCLRRQINNIDYNINEIDVQITQEKPKVDFSH